MSKIRWYGPTLVLLLTMLAAVLAGPILARRAAYAYQDAQVTLVQDRQRGDISLAELSESFKNVARIVEPSVVHIAVSTRRANAFNRGFRFEGQPGQAPDELFRRFGQPGQPGQRGDDDKEHPALRQYDVPQEFGNGSGWVYDRAGHIITNNHVIADADDITVRFHDGSERKATVIGSDPSTDVAVLKVEGDAPRPAKISDEAVDQGEIVFAFGSPFRFDFSMSQGIVSAKGRKLDIIRDAMGRSGYENFIQTDAAINPGNSGGPLTNIYGEVIGMNTAIASRNGVYNGLGFAIPVRMVTEVADQIIDKGKVSRGFLGVFIDDLDATMAKTFGYDGKGVLVMGLNDDSPAADAGLKRGDIITAVDGTKVETAEALRYLISRKAPGVKVELTLHRDGKQKKSNVTLGEMPGDATAMLPTRRGDDDAEANNAPAMDTLRKLGIESVETFDTRMARQLGTDEASGVVVTSVRANSLAASRGIREGAVITGVQGKSVENVEQLTDALAAVKEGQAFRLSVEFWNPSTRGFIETFMAFEKPE